MARGDGRVVQVTATYPEAVPQLDIEAGDPYPLNDKDVYFTARRKFGEAATVAPVIAKTKGSGIAVRSSPDEHIADISITSDDTEDLSLKKLYWDVRAKPVGQDPLTVAEGVLLIVPNATRL